MGKKRALIFVLSTPYFLLGFFFSLFRLKKIIKDYEKCLGFINARIKDDDNITMSLINYLRIAEDHRQLLHFGVDPIAIIRAFYLRLFKGIKQGASTIEQQLVRTITGRYEKTIRRKVREQIIAIWIRKRFAPNEICKCYISCCYYGYGTYGIKKLTNKIKDIDELGIVSRIKYPFRKELHLVTEEKYAARVEHVKKISLSNNIGTSIFLK